MGRDAMLLAGTNEEAAELAAMVRAELVRHGRVPEKAEVRLADGNGAGTGTCAGPGELPRDRRGRAPAHQPGHLRLDGTTLAAGGRVARPGASWRTGPGPASSRSC